MEHKIILKFSQVLLVLTMILWMTGAQANIGQVHAGGAKVSEDGQKAIILHNMTEEIMILGTELRADKKTGIIRFIPFPAEPHISSAATGAFVAVSKLTENHGLKFFYADKAAGPAAKGVELRLHTTLGAHDLTVLKVDNPLKFKKWVNGYFKKHGLPGKASYPEVEAIVEDYVQRGFFYFVLDYVAVTTETRFVEPVMYRFRSKQIYYPLKTSNTFGGEGTIDLILIAPRTMCRPSLDAYSHSGPEVLGLPEYAEASTSDEVMVAELEAIYPEAKRFFGKQKAYVQMVSYRGKYGFQNDILQDPAKGVDAAYGNEEQTSGPLNNHRASTQEENPKLIASVQQQDVTAELVKGNTQFAFELYQRINAHSGDRNIFISPLSLSVALAMTYAGARDRTERQMAATLHCPAQEYVHSAFFSLLEKLDDSGRKGCKLYLSNRLWCQDRHPFRDDFLGLTKKYYAGDITSLDFIRKPEESRMHINRTVAEETAGKIQGLLNNNDVDALTQLVLTNAIYFKGDWASRFEKPSTTVAPFYKTAKVAVEVWMMHGTGRFGYAEVGGKLKIVELPYVGGDLSMLVILPEDGLKQIEFSLGHAALNRWRSMLKPMQVKVALPRFTFSSRYVLNGLLADMGMPDAFDAAAADFSGMDGEKALFLSKVIHQSDIEVNEEGAEAASASAVVMTRKSLPEILRFDADHPFLFTIIHKPTGTILFLGRVADPTQP